jgi:hypothetical protein
MPELLDEDVIEYGNRPEPDISQSWRHSRGLRGQGESRRGAEGARRRG